MIVLTLNERILESKDWILLLLLLCFIIIAIAKNTYANRFGDYINLLVSDKYVRIYKDSVNLKSWFTIFLFLIQSISFSLFIHYLLCFFLGYSKTDWILYIQILNFFLFFLLSKFLVEKIVTELFKINDFVEQFSLLKINYRTYISLILLPIIMVLYYNNNAESFFIYGLIFIFMASNVLIYINGIKIFQNLILGNLFYFILYLCTFEIAPYYFMYYLFTRNH